VWYNISKEVNFLKIDKLKIELSESICNSKTGEDINIDELVDKILSCNKQDKRKKQREGLRKKTSEMLLEFDVNKMKRRSFDLIYSDDIKEKDLDINSHWIYTKLRENLVKDGSCRVNIITDEYIVDSRNKLYRFCNIGKSTGAKALKRLEDLGFVKIKNIKRKCIFYIHPELYRFGNKITKEAREIFDIPFELFKD